MAAATAKSTASSASSSLWDELLSSKQRLAVFGAALGAGVLVGAGGIVVYQRLNQNVSLSVTGRDFSQELTTLSQSIQQLRKDIENLKRGVDVAGLPPSILKNSVRKRVTTQVSPVSPEVDLEVDGGFREDWEVRRQHTRRTLSNCSSFTNGSSSGTEYFSALSDEEELFEQQQQLSYEDQQTLNLLNRVDELMEGREDQQKEALDLLMQEKETMSSNPAYLWRLCKGQYLLSVVCGQTDNTAEKKDLIMKAVESGEKALGVDDQNAEAHKWFAIALGSRGEFGGVREKILDGFEFKKHIDIAAQLNPRDYITHHLLGRFCYEVSQLSWLERKMAGTLFAEPPTATLTEALQHFMAAEELKPEGWKENRLYIAKCHIGMGDYVAGLVWLDSADSIPLASADVREGIKDRISQQEIEALINKYKGYRK